MSRIFINYRRQDSEGYVGRLYDHLCQHFEPDDIFMDVEGIRPGADFVTTLEEAVSACDVFIAIVGPQWLVSAGDDGMRRLDDENDFVRLEIASALKQDKQIIPVLVGRGTMPSSRELPEEIAPFARRHAVELSHQRFGYDAQQLIAAIQETLRAKASPKPPANSETLLAKQAALKATRDDLVKATDSPLYQHRIDNRYFPVLGDGNPDANIVFIGEAPGKYEAAQGIPFVGPSGEILDEMLRSIGLKRADIFVTNLLLDFPPAGRDPLPTEIAFYAPFLDRIIDTIRPAVIATLGRFAMQHLLKKLDLPEQKAKISTIHGKLIKTRLHYGEIHVVPLYHPAMVLYSASQKDVLIQDFQKLKLFV